MAYKFTMLSKSKPKKRSTSASKRGKPAKAKTPDVRGFKLVDPWGNVVGTLGGKAPITAAPKSKKKK